MKHDLAIQGQAFGLRPLTVEDAEFIVELRTDPDLGKHLHATSPNIEDQREWTRRYFDREGDWYFIVEHKLTHEPQGAISIYNFDEDLNQAEWGRWILRKGSLAALESAALVYEIGFNELKLDLMYAHTEAANETVVSFHTSFGAQWSGPVAGPEDEQWIEQLIVKKDWPEIQATNQPKIAAAAAFALR